MLVEFLEVGLEVVKHVTCELDLSFLLLIPGSDKELESIELKFTEIELLDIEYGDSFLLLLLLMEIIGIIESSLVDNIEFLVLEFSLYLFYRSFSVCVMNVDKVRFVEMGDCRVEGLFMEAGLTGFAP